MGGRRPSRIGRVVTWLAVPSALVYGCLETLRQNMVPDKDLWEIGLAVPRAPALPGIVAVGYVTVGTVWFRRERACREQACGKPRDSLGSPLACWSASPWASAYRAWPESARSKDTRRMAPSRSRLA
jgi:hypothetical protein